MISKSLFALIIGGSIALASAQVDVYPWPATLPTGLKIWGDATVEVRAPGGTWQAITVFEHLGMLGKPGGPIGGTDGFAAFGSGGSTDVRVTYKTTLTNVKILPGSAGMSASWSGAVATFTIPDNRNVVVNFNGDANHPLQLFCNPRATDAPSATDNNTDYYGAGTVTEYRNTNRRDIYIAPGAIVTLTGNATMATKQNNARFYGYGLIFRKDPYQMLQTYGIANMRLEGVIFTNTFQPAVDGGAGGQWTWWIHLSSGVVVNNVKFFDSYYAEDAIDLDRTHDVTITNCFFHIADDAIAVKAQYWGQDSWQHPADPPSCNIAISGCVFWQEYYGSPLHIGYESYSTNPNDTFYNIKLTNSDVVRMMSGAPLLYVDSKQGCDFGRSGVDDDILLQNIRVENADSIVVVRCEIDTITPRTDAGSIRNVTLRNINVIGGVIRPLVFQGFDATHLVSDVTIDGISRNSVCQPSSTLAIQKNQYTSNISVLQCSTTMVRAPVSSNAGWLTRGHTARADVDLCGRLYASTLHASGVRIASAKRVVEFCGKR